MSFNLVIQGVGSVPKRMLKKDEKPAKKVKAKPDSNFLDILQEQIDKLEKTDPVLHKAHCKAKELSLTNKFDGKAILVITYKKAGRKNTFPLISTTGAEWIEKPSVYCVHGMWYKGVCVGYIPKELQKW